MMADIRLANELMKEGKPGEALPLLLRILRREEEVGFVPSPYLRFSLAGAYDALGDPMKALDVLDEAVRLDPLMHPGYEERLDIADRIRRALTNGEFLESKVEDAYQALASRGLADGQCHLAMARRAARQGRWPDVLRFADLVLAVAPKHEEGLGLRNTATRRMGYGLA